jgi:WhiB family redox-sensing transcriptional regulator
MTHTGYGRGPNSIHESGRPHMILTIFEGKGHPTLPTLTPLPGRGACADHDPEVWQATDKHTVTAAKRICAGCPIVDACRAAGLDGFEPVGTWGGLTADDRKRLRRHAKYERAKAREAALTP